MRATYFGHEIFCYRDHIHKCMNNSQCAMISPIQAGIVTCFSGHVIICIYQLLYCYSYCYYAFIILLVCIYRLLYCYSDYKTAKYQEIEYRGLNWRLLNWRLLNWRLLNCRPPVVSSKLLYYHNVVLNLKLWVPVVTLLDLLL